MTTLTIKSSDFIAFVDGVGDIFKMDNGAEEGERCSVTNITFVFGGTLSDLLDIMKHYRHR